MSFTPKNAYYVRWMRYGPNGRVHYSATVIYRTQMRRHYAIVKSRGGWDYRFAPYTGSVVSLDNGRDGLYPPELTSYQGQAKRRQRERDGTLRIGELLEPYNGE